MGRLWRIAAPAEQASERLDRHSCFARGVKLDAAVADRRAPILLLRAGQAGAYMATPPKMLSAFLCESGCTQWQYVVRDVALRGLGFVSRSTHGSASRV